MLQLLLDEYEFARYDFGTTINFKLYDNSGNQFDADGFTGVIKAFKRHGDRAFFFRDVAKALTVVGQIAQIIGDIDVTWTTQNIGEGSFKWTSSNRPSIPGVLWIELQLKKSDEQLSSELIRTYVHPSEAA